MATIGFEEKLWASADKLRNNMDASEYKHVVLGLIFLRSIVDGRPDWPMSLIVCLMMLVLAWIYWRSEKALFCNYS